MSNIKEIILPSLEKKTNNKVTNKRKIVNTKIWENSIENINEMNPIELIEQLKNEGKVNDTQKLIHKNIITKIQGYKNQDKKKKIYNEEQIIDIHNVIDLLYESKLLCNYCKTQTNLLYENVKDPKQWTLDRLDNNIGHNKGNLVISCLECNLKRKTMHFKRFEFTKQLQIIKNEDNQSI
jgi:hypothetical protein